MTAADDVVSLVPTVIAADLALDVSERAFGKRKKRKKKKSKTTLLEKQLKEDPSYQPIF